MKKAACLLIPLALLITFACTERNYSQEQDRPLVIVLKLEDDIDECRYSTTFNAMLNEFHDYRFMFAPKITPEKSYLEWTDADYASLAKRGKEQGAELITFGRVVQGEAYIGFLPTTATKQNDSRFYLIQLHHFENTRQLQLDRALEEFEKNRTV